MRNLQTPEFLVDSLWEDCAEMGLPEGLQAWHPNFYLQDATPKSQGAVALMQEMPVKHMDGGEALLRCTCLVVQSSIKFFAPCGRSLG